MRSGQNNQRVWLANLVVTGVASLGLLWGSCISTATIAQADEPATGETDATEDSPVKAATLETLLTDAWGTQSKFRAIADEQLAQIPAEAIRSSEGLYAKSLVLMHQRRYDEALASVNELLRKEPKRLSALRAKTWILTTQRKHAAALESVQQLLTLVVTQVKAAGAEVSPNDEQKELLGFVGRVLGFLGGPLESPSTAELRRLAEKKMLTDLDEKFLASIELARDAVLQRYTEFSDVQEGQKSKAKAVVAEEKEATLKEVAEVREENAEKLKQLESKQARLDAEAKQEVKTLTDADLPLQSQLAQLQSRQSLVSADLANISVQINQVERDIRLERDANRRNGLIDLSTRLNLTANRIDAELQLVNRQVQGCVGQRQVLAAKAQAAQANYARQQAVLNKEAYALGKREKKADNEETRAKKAVAHTPASALSLNSQATSFGTYDTFPLESERSELLKVLR